MPPRKKATAKPAAKRQRKSRQKADAAFGAPEGFSRVEYAERWDCEKQPILQGRMGKVQTVTVPVGRGNQEERRCVDVTQEDGTVLTVWEAAGLSAAFQTVPEGAEIYIAYQGLGDAKPNQNAPKIFDVYSR